MKDVVALRPLLGVLALFGCSLLLIAPIVKKDSGVLVSPPEVTAKQFLRALKIHNYAGARDHLTERLAGRLQPDMLRSLVEAREAERKHIDQVREEGSVITGETAKAAVAVKLADRQEAVWEFTLVKEKGLWKLSSLGPLGPAPS
jgi:hypothetical protein